MENEIKILDIIRVVFKYKYLILAFVLVSVVLSAVRFREGPKQYEASAKVLIIQERSSNFERNLAYLFRGGRGSEGGALGAIIKSRSLAENVAQEFDLKVLFAKRWDEETQEWDKGESPTLAMAANRVASRISYKISNNVLDISAVTNDPALSALIANTYVKKLQEYAFKNSINISLNILDLALPPQSAERSSSRSKLVVFAAIMSLMTGIMFAFFINYLKKFSWSEFYGALDTKRR
ncbi:MAG: hypothetical protein HQ564_05180 [Candidatus Saganbacteria bacterium]|nr:hypothetical protein [Candidatus Saganbacteria bacterium]